MRTLFLVLAALAVVAAVPAAAAHPTLDDVQCLPDCAGETLDKTVVFLQEGPEPTGCRPYCT